MLLSTVRLKSALQQDPRWVCLQSSVPPPQSRTSHSPARTSWQPGAWFGETETLKKKKKLYWNHRHICTVCRYCAVRVSGCRGSFLTWAGCKVVPFWNRPPRLSSSVWTAVCATQPSCCAGGVQPKHTTFTVNQLPADVSCLISFWIVLLVIFPTVLDVLDWCDIKKQP